MCLVYAAESGECFGSIRITFKVASKTDVGLLLQHGTVICSWQITYLSLWKFHGLLAARRGEAVYHSSILQWPLHQD